MKARKLTIEQKEDIQGVFFDRVTFFNCIQDIDDYWFIFLSNGDVQQINGSQWQWVVDLPLSEYVPPVQPSIPTDEE